MDDIIKGRTQRSNEATLRPLREWSVRMRREGYEVDRAGAPTEDAKLIAIAYMFQDYPVEQQKEFAHEFYEKLYDGYKQTGAIPKWMARLKNLIDREWP